MSIVYSSKIISLTINPNYTNVLKILIEMKFLEEQQEMLKEQHKILKDQHEKIKRLLAIIK